MNKIARYHANAARVNSRLAKIAADADELFGLSLKYHAISATPPKRLNAQAADYINAIEEQTVKGVNAVIYQLSRYHVVAPAGVSDFNFDWSGIDATLSRVEHRLRKYY